VNSSSSIAARSIGAIIAPPELVAAHSCITYGECVFLPKIEAHAGQQVAQWSDTRAAMAKLLARYDSFLAGMCREVADVFQRNPGMVLDAYARQLPGDNWDIELFLAIPGAARWASETAAFLIAAAPLIQYHALAKRLAPELLTLAEPDQDWTVVREVRETSVGMAAQAEREALIQLLADDGFRQLAPDRFDLATLRKDEARLRQEAARVKDAALYWFNDNASDLVRMHFNGFDTMRATGLADVYLKYEHKLEEVWREE
jgi:hypothetical protein